MVRNGAATFAGRTRKCKARSKQVTGKIILLTLEEQLGPDSRGQPMIKPQKSIHRCANSEKCGTGKPGEHGSLEMDTIPSRERSKLQGMVQDLKSKYEELSAEQKETRASLVWATNHLEIIKQELIRRPANTENAGSEAYPMGGSSRPHQNQ